jgi:hypothetical protein
MADDAMQQCPCPLPLKHRASPPIILPFIILPFIILPFIILPFIILPFFILPFFILPVLRFEGFGS